MNNAKLEKLTYRSCSYASCCINKDWWSLLIPTICMHTAVWQIRFDWYGFVDQYRKRHIRYLKYLNSKNEIGLLWFYQTPNLNQMCWKIGIGLGSWFSGQECLLDWHGDLSIEAKHLCEKLQCLTMCTWVPVWEVCSVVGENWRDRTWWPSTGDK